MKAITLAGALLLATSSASFAGTCTSTVGWGSLGPPGFEVFGNSFRAAGSYTDCYSFSLSGSSNTFGGALEINTLFNKLDIGVSSVSLVGGSLAAALVDNSPLDFSFTGLLAGVYELAVTSVVTNDPGLWTVPVGYSGLINSVAAEIDPPTSVAEPATLSLLGFGLVGAAVMRRRQAN